MTRNPPRSRNCENFSITADALNTRPLVQRQSTTGVLQAESFIHADVCGRVDEVTAATQYFSRSTLLTKENCRCGVSHVRKSIAWRSTRSSISNCQVAFSNEQSVLIACQPSPRPTSRKLDVRSQNLKLGTCLVSRRVHPCPSGHFLDASRPSGESSIRQECLKVGEGTPSVRFQSHFISRFSWFVSETDSNCVLVHKPDSVRGEKY